MKVGVQLPEVERVVRRAELAAMARAAEDCGFDSIWVGDHLLYDLPGGVTVIDTTVAEIFEADQVAERLARLTGLRAESWMETNGQLLNALASQSMTTEMIRVFVGISVAFGIASVLAVSVVQRTREIGILRAMGAKRGQVLRIFLVQGALLGLLGSVSGSALGAGTLVAWHAFARQADGGELFPLVLGGPLFAAALALACLTGVAAAAAPAVRAARLDPVAAIRG